MKAQVLVITLMVSILGGCAGIRSMALKVASPMVYEAGNGLMREGNWESFKNGILGNLMLMEGLLSVQPENRYLLTTVIKGYTGYAFAVLETEYLDDKLAENGKKYWLNQTIMNYTRAFDYGMSYLALEDLTFEDLQKAEREPGGIKKLLDDNFSSDIEDLEAIFFTAQALGSMINLQRTDMKKIGNLGVAKGMFDWVCEKKPDINFGACSIFYGSYEAGRPKMLGGNPEKGRQIFEKFINDKPNNWLARIAFIEYYVIPMSDEDIYNDQKRFLEKAFHKHEADLVWTPGYKKPEDFNEPNMRLFQAIAMKRFQTIKKYAKDIF